MKLDVYIKGERIGSLYENDWMDYGFAYAPHVVERMPCEPLLSFSMPVRAEPYGHEDVAPYIAGLLPHGPRHMQLVDNLGINDPDDDFTLLAEIGRDCPGAVCFLPEGTELAPDEEEPVWLDEGDLEELIGEDPEWLCDPEDPLRMRFALPGERHKLALVYDAWSDRWAWPTPKFPSTHIIKPAPFVEGREIDPFNEFACTTAMRELGLPVAHAQVRSLAGRACLISRRFDRWGEGVHAKRIHYESFSQALGFSLYDREGLGPGYAEARVLLESIGESKNVEGLFIAGYCNFLLGNWDEPLGTNGGIIYSEAGPILAPFHDFSAKFLYDDPRALYTLEELAKRNSCLIGMTPIGIECGFALQPTVIRAMETSRLLLAGVHSVLKNTPPEMWWMEMVDDILRRMIDRFLELTEEIDLMRPPGTDPQSPPEEVKSLLRQGIIARRGLRRAADEERHVPGAEEADIFYNWENRLAEEDESPDASV